MTVNMSNDPKFVDELVRCKVCLECYDISERKPKFLQCHHSFCLKCLEDWATKLNSDSNSGGSSITCPTCRQNTEISPQKGVSALNDDFIVLKIMAAMDEMLSMDPETDYNKYTTKPNGVPKWCKTCMKVSGFYCMDKHEVCTYDEASEHLIRCIVENKRKIANLLSVQLNLNESLLAFLQFSHQAVAGTILHGIQEQINSRNLNMTMARSKLNMLPSLFPEGKGETLENQAAIYEETEKHLCSEESQKNHIQRQCINKDVLQNCKITISPIHDHNLIHPGDTFSIIIDSGGKNSEERALIYLLHKIFNDKGIHFSFKNGTTIVGYSNGTFNNVNNTVNIPFQHNSGTDMVNKTVGSSSYHIGGGAALEMPTINYRSFSLFNGGTSHPDDVDTDIANKAITNIVQSNKANSFGHNTGSTSTTTSELTSNGHSEIKPSNVNDDSDHTWQIVDSKKKSTDGKSAQMYSVVAKVNGVEKKGKSAASESKSTENLTLAAVVAAPPRKPTIVLNKDLGSSNKKSNCFFEFEVNGAALGMVTVKLRHDTAPKMCANFVALCTGQLGFGYRGSKIFKVHANDHIVGGDFENNDGTGGYSIYNNKGYFLADDSGLKDEVGAVRMRGMGTDDKTGAGKVGSQFHIWVGERDFRSYKRTLVIGKVIDGLDVLQKISCFKTIRQGDGFTLTKDVIISNCGLL